MILEWNVPMTVEFPEEELEKIVNSIQEDGWDYNRLVDSIDDVVMGFDDSDYFAWSEEQTKEVVNEVKRRIGGVQLSMFNNEVSES